MTTSIIEKRPAKKKGLFEDSDEEDKAANNKAPKQVAKPLV